MPDGLRKHLETALWSPPTPQRPQTQAAAPVAWLSPWRKDQVTTDYDAYGKHGIPLYTAPQPVALEPGAWKHDCAALLTNDVELWIDACPHCGKPRNAPQPVAREPLPKFLALKFHARRDKKATVTLLFPGHEAADAWVRGIKGGQHEPKQMG